ncbi:MAG: ABC transporter substrate-binding protein [Alphaproteobacteria bacterium]|nr:ABC transporter substrate-binding protein [Alphaproteobacteria bacterium]
MRLILAVLFVTVAMTGLSRPATAATPAEQFIAENVQRGLTILNDKQLSKVERRTQFQEFLLSLTDIRLIADYTLGQYRRTATPDQLAAYETAFKDYALAVYQGYFSKYTGQTLQVVGSTPPDDDETIVKTVMVDPKKGGKPLEVDFRVLNRAGHFLVVDFSVEGVWIRELERSDFTSYLGQHGGNVSSLIQVLRNKTQQNG